MKCNVAQQLIKVNTASQNTTIGLVYNPQENKTTYGELEEVYGRIESEIKNAMKMEQHIIVMEDINCKICDLIDGNKEEIKK